MMLSQLSLGLTSPAVPTRASAPTMAFKTDTPRPDLQSGLDFTWDKPWGDSKEISDKAGLQALAKKLNPILGYWDPMNIGETSKENIAWFRHAEIKHGRVAMAAFVGFTLQSNGVVFPWSAPVRSTVEAPARGVRSRRAHSACMNELMKADGRR